MSGDIQDCNKVTIAVIHGSNSHAYAGPVAQNLEAALLSNFESSDERLRFQAEKLPGDSWMVNLDRASLNSINSPVERLMRQYEIAAFVKGFLAATDNLHVKAIDFLKKI